MRKRSWYNRAKEKQIKYKHDILRLNDKGEHGKSLHHNILSIKDSQDGRNFYCHTDKDVWDGMKNWVKKSTGKAMSYDKSTLRNMLRSEHIAYNIFYPLELLRRYDHKKLVSVVQGIVKKRTRIKTVEEIRIEYTPDKKRLKDRTSFDAYIKYKNAQGQTGALGIEIKYTEKSYSSNDKQKRELKDDKSIYNKLTLDKDSYYHKDANLELRKKKLKQPWRNHLMGIALVERAPKLLDEFFSVLFYHEENEYQKEVCDLYVPLLKDDKKDSFIGLTFESFIQLCEDNGIKDKWLAYLKKRY